MLAVCTQSEERLHQQREQPEENDTRNVSDEEMWSLDSFTRSMNERPIYSLYYIARNSSIRQQGMSDVCVVIHARQLDYIYIYKA